MSDEATLDRSLGSQASLARIRLHAERTTYALVSQTHGSPDLDLRTIEPGLGMTYLLQLFEPSQSMNCLPGPGRFVPHRNLDMVTQGLPVELLMMQCRFSSPSKSHYSSRSRGSTCVNYKVNRKAC